MNRVLSIALIIVAILATSLPVTSLLVMWHGDASSCHVKRRAGGKRIFVTHIKDGDELYYSIDGVQQKQIFHGPTATGSWGTITVTDGNGKQICSRQ